MKDYYKDATTFARNNCLMLMYDGLTIYFHSSLLKDSHSIIQKRPKI